VLLGVVWCGRVVVCIAVGIICRERFTDETLSTDGLVKCLSCREEGGEVQKLGNGRGLFFRDTHTFTLLTKISRTIYIKIL